MKLGFIFVVVLLASTFGATYLLSDPGYVVITVRGYLIEMSVPILLALFALTAFGTWFIIKLLRGMRKLGGAAGQYRSNRAGKNLTRGVIEIAEGNFAKGERMLARAADVSDAPLLNYLQAARAAHLLGKDERRDGWLREAYENLPDAANAVLLTQAELQLDQAQYESALATLRRIEDNSPNHGHALMLLGRLYYRLEDWDNLSRILPRLKKHGRLDDATWSKWSLRVHRETLAAAADGQAVNLAWGAVPKKQRKEIELLDAYYSALIRTGMHDQAEKELSADLRRDWRPSLVRLYGMVESANGSRQLKKVENWLRKHGEDPDLLLASARLCLRNELWGKARSYLETVIALRPTPEAYHEYGRLLNQLGEGDAAADAYRAGLGLAAPSAGPAIPRLEKLAPDEDTGDSE